MLVSARLVVRKDFVKLEDVNKTAELFLRSLETGKPFYSAEPIKVESNIARGSKIALRQVANPPFFVGFKGSGRPIFTHELRLAQSFDETSMSLYDTVDRLKTIGVEVEPHNTVWHEGRHVNEF